MYFEVSTARAKMLKYVNIMRVFEDPTEVILFKLWCNNLFFSRWQISNHCLKMTIHETEIFKEYITAIQIPSDNTNNAAGDETKEMYYKGYRHF